MGMMGKGGPMPQMNPQMMAMMQKGGMMGMMPGGPGMMGQMGKGGPGMGMPSMMGKGGPMPGMGGPPQQGPAPGGGPLSASALAAAPPAVQKQMIGEKLYMAVSKMQPELAGKITGMMLEMDNSELLILLDSEAQLKTKVDEALKVIGR
mmetsp:Transcript_43856/g.115982  ORF Transcript_43856/g.115982 Transcript_43856/m.115982 type:complete len:149 (+) Transcript_43856:2-448(+)